MEGLREGLVSVGRTVLGAFVFTGRSRRLDIAYYWLASMLLNAVFHFVATSLGEWDSRLVGGLVAEGVLTLPFFALFARRLHDQGRSGWWALLLPPLGRCQYLRDATRELPRLRSAVAGTRLLASGAYRFSILVHGDAHYAWNHRF